MNPSLLASFAVPLATGCTVVANVDSDEAKRVDDSYASYSALVPRFVAVGKAVVIRQSTMPGRECSRPIGPYSTRIAEAKEDREARGPAPLLVADRFDNPERVRVGSDREIEAITSHRIPGEDDGTTGITTFSAVGFSHDHDLAIVDHSKWCGLLCGYYQSSVFLREGDHWKELRDRSACLINY